MAEAIESPLALSSPVKPMKSCARDGCLMDAAFDRPDGLCYACGKIADGKMEIVVPHSGRPKAPPPRAPKGRGHHRARKSA
jgi:hypothetical protein